LFTFVQLELPWELGPADGRYLLRKTSGPEGNEPKHVVVLSTIGGERRGMLGRRSRTRGTDPRPATVPIARATIVDPVPLSLEDQASRWLNELDPEREAHAAASVLNRVLFAQRIAAAAPHIHEVSPAHALVVRAGFGEGEQVADGLWSDARELVLSRRRTGKRASVLRPQERLALLLSGRGEALLCEELTLRARLDLDQGRLELAAIELERAYAMALRELPREKRPDLQPRIEELRELNAGVAASAHANPAHANPPNIDPAHANPPHADPAPEALVRHALERLEAALRARTATGFASS
jgi:hypothetical protein